MAGSTHRQFGSLRKLPSGRWQAAYTGPDRQRHTAPATFADKTTAAVWLDRARAAISEERWQHPATPAPAAVPTFAEFAEEWLTGRVLRPSTAGRYRRILDRLLLPEFGDRLITSITPAQVRAFNASFGEDTPAMRAATYGLLAAIMRTAAQDGVIPRTPCTIRGGRAAPKVHRTTVITPRQLDLICRNLPERYRLMVSLTAFCALRWGEVTELRRADVDADVIRVRRAVVMIGGDRFVGPPKTGAGARDIAVPPHLRPALAEHLLTVPAGGLLFPGAGGGHLPRRTFMDAYASATAAAGCPGLRFHDLRHVGAVLAAQAGATLAELMARLGHSSPRVAMQYQHAAAGRDQVIAERLSALAAL